MERTIPKQPPAQTSISSQRRALSNEIIPLAKATIGIVGVGMVGGAVQRYFDQQGRKLFLFDTYKKIGSREEVNQADIIFISVPTPYFKSKEYDLSMLEQAIQTLTPGKIIILKSTMLPGTTEWLQRKYPEHRFCYNPEFLTEATADQDMAYPDRQILGYTSQTFTIAKDLLSILPLAPFERLMPATEAEMVKMFGNTWFATKVAFANQMYDVCQNISIDYERVMEAAAADKRIGRTHLEIFHKDYRGYGGKCLPKDIKAFIEFAERNQIDLKIHKAAEAVNENLMKKQHIPNPEQFSKRE